MYPNYPTYGYPSYGSPYPANVYHQNGLRYTDVQQSEPESEPVALSLVKNHLSIDHSDDDNRILSDIRAARIYSETITGRIFGPRPFLMRLDCWPYNKIIALKSVPVVSLETIKYEDSNGVQQTIDAANYRTWLDYSPPLVRFTTAFALPVVNIDAIGGIEIAYTAGESVIPETLVKATQLICGYWYANPGGEQTTDNASKGIPAGAMALLSTLWTGEQV